MGKSNGMKVFVYVVGLAFLLVFCSHAAPPPKPGPDFVWIEAHTTQDGIEVPGHWKYVGPEIKGRAWVPGHYNENGKWVEGEWKNLPPPPGPKAVWTPGHYGPHGRWIPGHWR